MSTPKPETPKTPETPAKAVAPSIPSPSVARIDDLPAEWQSYFRALHVSAQQLVMRLAALEHSGAISAESAAAYADWVERMARALALVPIQDDSE